MLHGRGPVIGLVIAMLVFTGVVAVVPFLTSPRLHTAVQRDAGLPAGCRVSAIEGRLAADATYGTTIQGQPVIWQRGFTARRAGSELEIVNPEGVIVATTGHDYRIEGGYGKGGFWACGDVTQ